MDIYLVIRTSCDDARLGRVWAMAAFSSEEKAKAVLQKWMDGDRFPHMKGHKSATWQPETIEGKTGYALWHNLSFVYIDRKEVDPEDKRERLYPKLEI